MKNTARLMGTVVLALAVAARSAAAEVPRTLPANVAKVLAEAELFEVLSLEPTERSGPHDPEWRTLGRVGVTDRVRRRDVLRAIETDVAGGSGGGGSCFSPRHAIHASSGSHSVMLVICYACHLVAIYVNDKAVDPLIPIRPRSHSILNAILDEARVPRAKPEQ